MKKIAAALTGIVALTVAAGLLLSDRLRKPPAPDGDEAVASAPTRARSSSAAPDDTRLAELMKEGTAGSYMEMVSLYSLWSKNPARAGDRRTIVDEIVRRMEPREAINLLTMAVTGDSTPVESDTMIAEVARAMAPLWRDNAMFAEGRDMMRLAETDKTRALMAAALTERAKHPASGLPEISGSEQHELASDLIQIYMHTQDRGLKDQILPKVRSIAGPEVAEVLADPANAHNSLAARKAEQANREASAMLGGHQAP